MVLPQEFNNGLEGETYGIELSASWQPVTQVKITLAYSWMDLELDFKEPGNTGTPSAEQSFPRHQFVFTGRYDIHPNLCMDGELYYIDDFDEDDIESYLRLDLQLHWSPLDSLELSVGGENLFSSPRTEAIVNGTNVVSTEVGPIYWLKGTIWF